MNWWDTNSVHSRSVSKTLCTVAGGLILTGVLKFALWKTKKMICKMPISQHTFKLFYYLEQCLVYRRHAVLLEWRKFYAPPWNLPPLFCFVFLLCFPPSPLQRWELHKVWSFMSSLIWYAPINPWSISYHLWDVAVMVRWFQLCLWYFSPSID